MSQSTSGVVVHPDILKPFLKNMNTVAAVCKRIIIIVTNEAMDAQTFEKISHHAFREIFNTINNMMAVF
jgi:hypothetical protein